MNKNPQRLLGSLQRTSEPVDLTHGRCSYSSLEGEKSHSNFSFRKWRTWKSSNLSKKFLATLGLTGDWVIKTVLSKITTSRMAKNSDKKGKHTLAIQKKNNISQFVRDHVQKFHSCISHYRRAHPPNRLHISSEFTILSM